jgi:hypothetical protein
MARIYWISGSATAAQQTNSFIALVHTDSEIEAIAQCADALGKDWAAFEIEAIRTIDPALLSHSAPVSREAIERAQDEGFFLLICDQPISN